MFFSKILIAFIFPLFVFNKVQAQQSTKHPRATLLISFQTISKDESAESAEYKLLQYTVEYIAKHFHQIFSPYFDVRVHYAATQEDLFAELHNQENRAVFWVGHANEKLNSFMGGSIFDTNGIEISDLFTKVHPNIRWLGLISCSSFSKIVEYVKKDLYYPRDTYVLDIGYSIKNILMDSGIPELRGNGLVISASSTLVEAKTSALKTFHRSLKYLRSKEHENEVLEVNNLKFVDLTIKRFSTQGSKMNSVKILLNGNFIHLFPEERGSQSVILKVPGSLFDHPEFVTITVDSGVNSLSKSVGIVNNGEFEFTISALNLKSKIVTYNGIPLGIKKQVYQFEKEN